MSWKVTPEVEQLRILNTKTEYLLRENNPWESPKDLGYPLFGIQRRSAHDLYF